MKQMIIALLVSVLLLCGCANVQLPQQENQYTATFLTLFDTVTTIVGFAETKEDFSVEAQKIHDELLVYHQLFDIYEEYEDVVNLKVVNDLAGSAPVKVDPVLIDLLTDCKEYYELTDGKVNVAMGSVLSLWHDARSAGSSDPQNAAIPKSDALEHAAGHMNMKNLVIDADADTVYFSDPELRLDVGAIAKGWAAQRVAENAPEGMLISVGGNVCATGPKDDKGTPWVIGIQDPDSSEKNRHSIYVKEECVVTSGDYQRTFVVDGKRYHHIIDPETRMPADYWRSVSIVCGDSGLADVLSTALFLLPYEEGKALVEECGADAFWIGMDGEEYMTPGFEKMIRT